MGSNLGDRREVGELNLNNPITAGAWTVTFDPQVLPAQGDFEVWHGALLGPGGYAVIYLDNTHYGVAENGRLNEYAPAIPMYVRKGQFIYVHWSIGTGTAPSVTLFFRQPEVGRL